MRFKTDFNKRTGQTIVEVKDKDFYLVSIEKPHLMHNHKQQLKVIQYGDNHFSIETGTSFLYLYFSKSFNVKRIKQAAKTFNLQAESRLLDTLLEAANRFNADYERRQLSKLAKGNDYKNWREFYQDAELLQWPN